MAEILIKAVNATHADSDKDRRGCYKRGDPVVVMPDGHTWGALEGPPKFVLVKVPGITVAQALAYIAPWTRTVAFVVDSSNLATDTHTMTVSCTSGVSVSGEGALTRQQVEAYLDNWNAAVQSVSANAVTFTVSILDAIRSAGFWGRDVSAVAFAEVSYTQGSGNHRVRADYPAGIPAAEVEHMIAARDGTIVSHNTGTRRVTFDVTRAAVRSHFEEEVRRQLGSLWARRRFRLTEAEMNAIETAGGTVTRTPAQVQEVIRDRLEV